MQKTLTWGKVNLMSIFCIGRNYAEHARELNSPVPSKSGTPIVFMKPSSTLCRSGSSIELPSISTRVDHEVEIVVKMGGAKGWKNVPQERALEAIDGYAIGIDVTARDLQEAAKEKGLPWTLCKGFDTFAPLSDFVPASMVSDPSRLSFQLTVNGELRQKGSASEMIFSIPELIAHLSKCFTLSPGDLIFTGTPKGVAPIQSGDRLVAELGDGLARLEVGVRE